MITSLDWEKVLDDHVQLDVLLLAEVEGRLDHVVEVEKVVDELVEYLHQQFGLEYPVLLVGCLV